MPVHSVLIGLLAGLLALAGGGLFVLAGLAGYTGDGQLDRRIGTLLLAGLLALSLGVILLAVADGYPIPFPGLLRRAEQPDVTCAA